MYNNYDIIISYINIKFVLSVFEKLPKKMRLQATTCVEYISHNNTYTL